MKTTMLSLLCLALVGFCSCLGVSAEISIRPGGSGRIVLEYQVSQMLESIGRLDGNEAWPAIPVGRGDFERIMARIPGLRLGSHSSSEVRNAFGGRDLLTRATLDFDDTAALLAFLDSTGGHASLVQENGKNLLHLVLLEPATHVDNPYLASLLREVSEGYEVRISLNAPGNASLSVLPSAVPQARVVSQGRTVSFAIGMGDILGFSEGLALEIGW